MERLNIINKRDVDLAKIRHLLNPNFIDKIYLPGKVLIFEIQNPEVLILHPYRFDLICKYIYVKCKDLKINSDWHVHLYKEHLRALTNGTFSEFDGTKKSFSDYQNNFDILIKRILQKGFDDLKSIVLINQKGVVLEGAHRVSICAYYRIPITVCCVDYEKKYDFNFFINRGLAKDFLDIIAFEYCMLEEKSFVAILNSVASRHVQKAEQVLNKFGLVFYRKKVFLNISGYLNLVKIMYKDEEWLGNLENNFIGAKRYVKNALDLNKALYVFIVYADSLSKLREAKREIRKIAQVENYAIHINDSHQETIVITKAVLNSNSIHFLNTRKVTQQVINFSNYFRNYKRKILNNMLDENFFCISGSASLAAYGIRDVKDLDFVHFFYKDDILKEDDTKISSHNMHISKFSKHHIDELIFNPNKYFYYEGLKFQTISVLRDIKKSRGEAKDIEDIKQLDKLFKRKDKLLFLEHFSNYKTYTVLRTKVFVHKKRKVLSKKIRKIISNLTKVISSHND